MLAKCSEVTGRRYLVAEDVATGSFEFGNAKTLEGKDWVAAVEQALTNAACEWTDLSTCEPRLGRLALKRRSRSTTLVVPAEVSEVTRNRSASPLTATERRFVMPSNAMYPTVLLGDNSSTAFDSRNFGPVAGESILGRLR